MSNLVMRPPKLGQPALGIAIIRTEDEIKRMIVHLESSGKPEMAAVLVRYLSTGDYGDRDVEPGYWLTNKYSTLGEGVDDVPGDTDNQ